MESFILAAADGVNLAAYRWLPGTAPRSIVQLVHGMSEHARRYDELAQELAAAGHAVYAHDLRGHGQTAPAEDELGFLGPHDGWPACRGDLGSLRARIAADFPNVPVFLLGHSMGSFLAQHFAAERREGLAGLVLSGAYLESRGLARAGALLARLERMRLGPRGRSRLIRWLTFDAFNRRFAPARTAFDWLSRDPAAVDAYLADPRTGFEPSVQLWIDVLDALSIGLPFPSALPTCLLIGEQDPVGAADPSAIKLAAAFRAAGSDRIAHCVYPGARHELQHETNRAEVTRDLLSWMDQVLAMPPHPTGRIGMND